MEENIVTYGQLNGNVPYAYSCINYPVDLILALAMGVLLSPWKVFLLLFVYLFIFYELGLYFVFKKRWYPDIRAGIILAYILGWIIGRTILGFEDICGEDTGFTVPQMVRFAPLNFN